MTGLRVDLTVDEPGACPVADAAAATETPVTSVARSTAPNADGRVVEEFTQPGETTVERDGVDVTARYEGHTVHRFSREQGRGCVCDRVESLGHPVAAIGARDGRLRLTVHVPDREAVRRIVTELRETFAAVRVRGLVRVDGTAREDDADPAIVDRGRLTERQRECLSTAYRRGYFDHPRAANAGEVADALGVAPSTFREHLAAAQSALLGAVFDTTPERDTPGAD